MPKMCTKNIKTMVLVCHKKYKYVLNHKDMIKDQDKINHKNVISYQLYLNHKNNISCNNYKNQGSITVEASMIVPIILYVVFLLLYLVFYTMEAGAVSGIMGEELAIASNQSNTKIDEKDLQGILYEHISKHLYFSKELNVQVNQSHNTITAKVTAVLKLPIVSMKALAGGSTLIIDKSMTVSNEEITKILRRRDILDQGDKKGGS